MTKAQTQTLETMRKWADVKTSEAFGFVAARAIGKPVDGKPFNLATVILPNGSLSGTRWI